MSKVYGYIRVSTAGQDYDSQKNAIQLYLQNRGAHPNDYPSEYVCETVSGKVGFENRELKKLVERAELFGVGSKIYVSEISRIGRSLVDVLQFAQYAIDCGVTIVICNLDLTLDNSISSKTLVTIMGLAAELERTVLIERTRAGIRSAKEAAAAAGIAQKRRGGNKKYKLDAKHKEIAALLEKGVSKSSVAKIIGVSRNTLDATLSRIERQGRVI